MTREYTLELDEPAMLKLKAPQSLGGAEYDIDAVQAIGMLRECHKSDDVDAALKSLLASYLATDPSHVSLSQAWQLNDVLVKIEEQLLEERKKKVASIVC